MAKKKTTKKAAKKVAAKKAVKKVAVKKAPAKKAAKKVAAKKVAAKKVAVKKAVKKAAPKKAIPAKAPAKTVEKTSIIARVDVGFGNSLYVRGEGAGLSWDKGIQLDNVSPYEWSFASTQAKGDVTFKFLINDEIWAEGENGTVAAGDTSITSPVFAW
ncbi:hypothetical protein QEH52_09480 [Coraliomargarita sp. SDUM461003]|uniref:CBM20 domain-containing protein n=1 Tax=Thalassobacterium maritimum TaxID=3041265 RepID=A0ABU1AX75_9BACT|nr:hypothetical protein [Coraliomargarita sp. SDUM461003]MDQ8207740.1 hypothetical protein [Coraliomargarita sp. SDUM461003]